VGVVLVTEREPTSAPFCFLDRIDGPVGLHVREVARQTLARGLYDAAESEALAVVLRGFQADDVASVVEQQGVGEAPFHQWIGPADRYGAPVKVLLRNDPAAQDPDAVAWLIAVSRSTSNVGADLNLYARQRWVVAIDTEDEVEARARTPRIERMLRRWASETMRLDRGIRAAMGDVPHSFQGIDKSHASLREGIRKAAGDHQDSALLDELSNELDRLDTLTADGLATLDAIIAVFEDSRPDFEAEMRRLFGDSGAGHVSRPVRALEQRLQRQRDRTASASDRALQLFGAASAVATRRLLATAESERTAREQQNERDQRFNLGLSLVAALVVAPTLLLALYGANVWLPASTQAPTWAGVLGAVVVLAGAVALGTFGLATALFASKDLRTAPTGTATWATNSTRVFGGATFIAVAAALAAMLGPWLDLDFTVVVLALLVLTVLLVASKRVMAWPKALGRSIRENLVVGSDTSELKP
jgi:hypothetical protein